VKLLPIKKGQLIQRLKHNTLLVVYKINWRMLLNNLLNKNKNMKKDWKKKQTHLKLKLINSLKNLQRKEKRLSSINKMPNNYRLD
jgi:hypothetical protein